jgi:hypothetical protein
LVVKSHEIDASPCPNGIETNYCYWGSLYTHFICGPFTLLTEGVVSFQ